MTNSEFDPSYDANKYFALKYGDKTVYREIVSNTQYNLEQYVRWHRFQLGFTNYLDFTQLEYTCSGKHIPRETIVKPGKVYYIICHRDAKSFGSSRPEPKNVYVITNVLVGDQSGSAVIVVREEGWVKRARALYTEAMLRDQGRGASTDLDQVYHKVQRLLAEFDAAIANKHYTIIPAKPETPEQLVNFTHGREF